MKIIEKRLKDLHPYEKNPRNNDGAVKYVAASIREFGFKVPIVIDSYGEIIAGHTRYKAAHELGLETVPCVVADDLNPQQIKAFRLADNKTAEMAEWDFEALNLELEGVESLDMSEFGFFDVEERQRIDISDNIELGDYKLIVEGSEEALEELYNRLSNEGYKCQIST